MRSRMTILKRLVALMGIGVVVLASCGEAPGTAEDALVTPRCGDGICQSSDCETSLRCPADCGVCVGAECNPVNEHALGSCGESCSSSCDCHQPGEVCTADFDGTAHGTCLPIACGQCPTG